MTPPPEGRHPGEIRTTLPDKVAIVVVLAALAAGAGVVGWLMWIDYFGPFGGELLPPTLGYLVYGLGPLVAGVALGWWGRRWLRR